MVKLIQKEEKTYYQCEECGHIYETEELAQKCENWCQENKSCNLEIIKYSVKNNLSQSDINLNKEELNLPQTNDNQLTNRNNIKSRNILINIVFGVLIGGSFIYALNNLNIEQNNILPTENNFQVTNNNTIQTNNTNNTNNTIQQIVYQVLPPQGFQTRLAFGDSVKKMIDCGVIDLEKMKKLYQGEIPEYIQEAINRGSDPIVINQDTANYLLNLFWPLGLSNKTEFNKNIPFGEKDLPYLASTGGWWLGKADNGAEYFNKCEIIKLTPEQEALVYEVAQNTFRPCCNNSTFAQDCNHGSALLGALELAASRGYSKDELYKLALQLNSFWFPNNYVKIALYKKLVENQDWPLSDEARINADETQINTDKTQMNTDNLNPRSSVSNPRESVLSNPRTSALIKEIMSAKYSSISGYLQNVEQKLAQLNLPGIQNQGSGCGL
jgi:hypothetical protein